MTLVVVEVRRTKGKCPGEHYVFYNDLTTKLQFAADDVALRTLVFFTQMLTAPPVPPAPPVSPPTPFFVSELSVSTFLRVYPCPRLAVTSDLKHRPLEIF